MNIHLLKLLSRARLMAPADEGKGGAAAEPVDRGDVHEPSDDDTDATQAALDAAAAAKAEKDGKADEKTDEEKEIEGLAAGKKKDGEEADGDEKDGKDGKGKKDSRIPLNRHEAILARERAQREALELELKQFKEGKAAVETGKQLSAAEAKVEELEGKYADLMAEGKTKEAAATMKEIRTTERGIIEAKAAYSNQVATAQAVETVRFDAVLERIEAAYPEIKPGSDKYDPDLVAEILDMQGAWVAKGHAPSAALQKAVGYILKPATGKQEDAVTTTPRVSTEDAAAAAKAARAAEQRKKNADASNSQPPSMAKTGANADAGGGVLDAKTVMKMPFEQFKKLSEEDLSRMRGDTI